MQDATFTLYSFFFLFGVYNNVITVTRKCFNDGKKLNLQFCAHLGGPSEDCVQWLGSSSATLTIHTVNRPQTRIICFSVIDLQNEKGSNVENENRLYMIKKKKKR